MSAAPLSSNSAVANAVMSNIEGQRDAQRLMHVLREGCAPADALLEAVSQALAAGDDYRIRGFARELQKALERSC